MAEISETPAGQNVNAEEPAGAEQPVSTEQPKDVQQGQTGKEVSKDARMWAMFCHLAGLARFIVPVIISGIIAPLIVWQIKKDDYPFVDEQGKEAVNFQITMSICALVSIALIPIFCIGAFLLAAVEIVDLIFLLVAAVKANNGYHYRYPLTIRFIK